MDLEAIVNLITNNGFAIVMCILLFKKMNEDADKHDKEIKELKDSINELNKTIQHFYDRMLSKIGDDNGWDVF